MVTAIRLGSAGRDRLCAGQALVGDHVSAYDASYLAVAEQLGCALLTADGRLGRVPGIRCPVTVVPPL